MSSLDSLFVEVGALAHHLRKTDFRTQQGDGLLAAGRKVLQILDEEGPRTVPAIAARQNSSRQNVQIIANRFEREGFVEFSSNPAHKKSDLLHITEKGRKALSASARRETKTLAGLPLELEESDLLSAIKVLRRVRDDLAKTESDSGKEARRKTANSESPATKALENCENESVAAAAEEEEHGLPVNLL